MNMSPSRIGWLRQNRQRGNLAAVVVIMIVAITLMLASALNLTLSSFVLGSAWEVKRTRDVAARATAAVVKDSILAKYEFSTDPDSRTLQTIVGNRVASIWVSSGPAISDTTDYTAFSAPSTAQWPDVTPATATAMDFTTTEGRGLGRNLQTLLSAGPVTDLGTRSFSFSFTSGGDVSSYTVSARLFSVPLTNFSLIPYADPSATGGVATSPPPEPSFTRSSTLSAPLVHAYTVGATNTFTDLWPSGSAGATMDNLPLYYRDLVGLTWNAFTAWRSDDFKNLLYIRAVGSNSVYSFSTPSTIPTGLTGTVTYASGVAAVNLGSNSAPSLIVFEDSTGGGSVRLDGATSGPTTPLVIVIRNQSATRTTVRLNGNNSRPVLIYAWNSTLTPSSAGVSFRGGILLFTNTVVSSSFNVAGSLFYPQTSASAPAITVTPDATARTALATVAPRALLVSARPSL